MDDLDGCLKIGWLRNHPSMGVWRKFLIQYSSFTASATVKITRALLLLSIISKFGEVKG